MLTLTALALASLAATAIALPEAQPAAIPARVRRR